MNNSLVKIFEQQVKSTPNRVAICFDGIKITYNELNQRANQVAYDLIAAGIKPGDVVGLLFDRSTDFMVAMWGILKARAIYLPLAPDLPVKRIQFMLEKGNASQVITQAKHASIVSGAFRVHTIEGQLDSSKPVHNLDLPTSAQDFAYCIFTSGSTGYPKGVLMKQSSIIDLVQGLKNGIYSAYENQNLKIALIASFSFDASVQQIFSAFLLGHTLYITDDNSRKSGASLRRFFNDNEIDISDGTPTHLRLVVNAAQPDSKLKTLSSWLLAGEVLNKSTVRAFYDKLGHQTQIFNLYGPTETCVDSTLFKVEPSILDQYETIPIGKPFANERIYITDSQGKLVPEGEVGELCIAGAGLAEGYINDFALTNERFMHNWIDQESRVYRTGDMVKLLADGNLLYQGRVDNQIKLRGLRIELSEIEFHMCEHPLVQHAVVAVREIFEEEQLVAYYEATEAIDASDFMRYLVDRLPNYMVPSHFLHLEQFPLNTNGKVDKFALPDVEVMEESTQKPLNEIEQKLVEIWEEILEVPKNWVGLETNFFQLGGNSLKSVLIANRIKQEFEVSITLAQFFEFQTVSKFSNFIATAVKEKQSTILPAGEGEIIPLTLAQKCFYFINSQKNNKSVSYNIPQVFELKGTISIEKLNRAFRKLIQRYEILRTSFVENTYGLECEVADDFNFSVKSLHFNGDLESTILEFLYPFDLGKGPLIRAGILSMGELEHLLILDIHHIITDEASNRILVQELFSLYEGMELPTPKLQYKDYAVWQQGDYYQNLVQEHKAYWLKQFDGEIPVLDLPADRPRPMQLSDEASAGRIKLDKTLSDKIRSLAAAESTTVFNFLLASYNLLLSKLSNQEDIIVGIPVSGRHHVDLERIVGLFVNTLALRNLPKGEQSFKTFLAEIKENTLQALDHQLYPYKALVDELKVTREVNRNPLFDVCFNYNQKIEDKERINDEFEIELFDMSLQIAKFDLILDVLDSSDEIELSLVGRKDLFDLKTIERYLSYLQLIIDQAVSNPSESLDGIQMLPASERAMLLAYNKSDGMEPSSILDVFAKQVQQTPDNEAVVFYNQRLTYKELDEQSNQLAHHLIAKGLHKEVFVGLMFDRSIEMIVSLLAILKAGSAYVPLDPEFPEDRIEYQVKDAKINWVVTTSNYESSMKKHGCSVVAVDKDKNTIASYSMEPVDILVKPDSLMYVIYTSGSTGKPKGVVVEHKGLVNTGLSLIRRFNITAADRILQFARITFDASISEILMAIFSGATLVLIKKENIIDGDSVIDFMKANKVSFVFFTPAYLRILDKNKLKFLRCIISGGEAAVVDDLQYLSKFIECHNVYGPTECSSIVTAYEVNPVKSYTSQIPIGSPFMNFNAYVLDKNDQLCPTGVIGELCIGGIAVTKGYLNRPALTAEKFVTNPLDPSEKMYRTGDYARWDSDGQLEFFGRKDGQVKIRGFRIELGEIQSVIEESEWVKQAAVLVTGEDKIYKQIVAYVVPTDGYDRKLLQNHMGLKLPGYMKPSSIIEVDSIPLTSHGKLDRKKLVKRQTKSRKTSPARAMNQTEQKILAIWSSELGLQPEKIGPDDNFFELGGNSLSAMQTVTRVNAIFGTGLTINEIFRFQTIALLAKQIEIDQWLEGEVPIDQKKERKDTILRI